MSQQDLSLRALNWRRGVLRITTASMEVTWVAGWTVVLLRPAQAAGLVTAWLSTFALYLIAMTTARVLSQRRTPRLDWIIGSLALVSTLVFLNLNLYPTLSLFSPRWLGTLVGNITSGAQGWPRELTALFIGFFVWYRGMRLPGRRVGIRTMTRHLQIGLAVILALVVASTRIPVNVTGVIVVYFAAGLLSLALTRIEETAQSQTGAASPFGRKWLLTLAGALLIVGLIALIATNVLTVEVVRTLLRPVALLAEAVLSAMAIVLGLIGQYILFPIIMRVIELFFPGLLDLEPLELEPQQQEQAELGRGEPVETLLTNPEFLNALRVVGLTLLTLIVLWLVIRSFRRWRTVHETAGGTRETATPAGSLAGDVAAYLRDQWQRVRELADVRRLFQMRGTRSIRAIYANLLMLMAAADHPRPVGQTPYEFEPTAEQVLPAHEHEISAITDAYVRARYGEQNLSEEELRRLRHAWEQVRTDGEKLAREKQTETQSN